MPQTQNSAFKPIYQQTDRLNDLPFKTSTPELCKKPSKSLLLNNRDESSSSSTLSSSSISAATFNKTPTVASALAANPLMHPFYIDKIFNFQNMFLFSNPGVNGINNSNTNNNSSNEGGITGSTQTNNLLSQTSNDLQNIMQQNLLQGFYNYYNTSTLLSNNNNNNNVKNDEENKAGLASTRGSSHEGSKIGNRTTETSSTKSSNSFSIDSILGGRNVSTKNPYSTKQTEDLQIPSQQKSQTFDYWTLYAAHQYFSQVRTQSTQLASQFHLQNIQNKNNPYLNVPEFSQNPIETVQAKLFNSNLTQQQPKSPVAQATQSNANSLYGQNNLHGSSLNVHLDKKFETILTKEQNPVVKSKNAKKYKCDLCGRGFSRSNTLITHRVSLLSLI